MEIFEFLQLIMKLKDCYIPRTTLSGWFHKWVNDGKQDNHVQHEEKRGKKRIMTQEEEKKLDNLLQTKYLDNQVVLVDDDISAEALAFINTERHGHSHFLRSNQAQDFRASSGWTRDFRKRHGLSCRTPSRTHVAAKDDSKDDQTIDYIAAMHVAVYTYGKNLVIGADETPIRSVAQNRKTIARTGSESVKLRKAGNEKEQCTAMLAIPVQGKKLKPMIITKGKTDACLKKLNLGKNIIGAYSKNGWITSKLVIKFMEESVLPYTKGEPCALSLDDYHAHWTQEVMEFAQEKKN